MKQLSLALLVVFVAMSVDAQKQYAVQPGTWVGCKSRETQDELVGYVVDDDKEAYRKALTGHLLTGECIMFERGETVYLEDTAMFSGLVKVRRRGETTAFWTNNEAID